MAVELKMHELYMTGTVHLCDITEGFQISLPVLTSLWSKR